MALISRPMACKRANGGFTAGAGTLDADFDFLHAVRHRLARGVLRDLLRGVGRAFARTFETNAAGARPADEIALHVGDGDLRVVERGQNVGDAGDNILRVLGLDDLLGIRRPRPKVRRRSARRPARPAGFGGFAAASAAGARLFARPFFAGFGFRRPASRLRLFSFSARRISFCFFGHKCFNS